MEVHAHAHTERKKWSHYLWEFLMLFLAVTLGFWAENLREERKRAEETHLGMITMLSDLRSDAAFLDSVMDRNSYGAAMADSVVELMHDDIGNTSSLYFAARAVTSNLGYYYTNSKSYDQLKSAGLLKLVRPGELMDSISRYYTTFQWLANQTDLMRLKMDNVHLGNDPVFDSYVFHKMMKFSLGSYTGRHLVPNRPVGNPPLLTRDPTTLNAVSLNYHYYASTLRFYNRTAGFQLSLARRLITWIEKEYARE
jgi:hypothetical protein